MAAPTTFKFGKLTIEVGDGGSPTEVFAPPCGFEQKALKLSKDLNEQLLPDCSDPDLPAWVSREVKSLSAEISGEGLLPAEALDTWQDFFFSTNARNVKVKLIGTTTETWAGKAHLNSFEISANLGEKVKVAVSMASDGVWTRTTA